MDTTVTGIFPNEHVASAAVAALMAAGFRPEQVRVVNADSPDRHEFIARRTSDTGRGVVMGLLLGTAIGTITGFALSGSLGTLGGPVAMGLCGAAGGTILGLWVGRATTTQVGGELEHQVDGGTVLVSVTTESSPSVTT